MLLALGCHEATAGQAESIKPALLCRGASGQAEENHWRLIQAARWSWIHFDNILKSLEKEQN